MELQLKNNTINLFGETVCFRQQIQDITLDEIKFLINNTIITPITRVSILNEDETIKCVIPSRDIVPGSVNYIENYQNQSRRALSLSLINSEVSDKEVYLDDNNYKNTRIINKMPYTPDVDGIWYGTKIKCEFGFGYEGQEYLFASGIYCVSDFQFKYGSPGKLSSVVQYNLQDKYYQFYSNSGVVLDGYEIPVDSSVDEVIKTIQNIPCADGTIYDIKEPIIHSKFFNFKTQQTISISEGGKLSDIYDSLATQMSAECYYDRNGNLRFEPIDESLNEINKPVVWQYDVFDLQELSLSGMDEIQNVVKVIGNNVNSENIYVGVAKNTNIQSPISIYRVKERSQGPIESQDVYSDKQAKELAEYYLKQKTIMQFNQSLQVPYNPLLAVNNIVEISCEKLNMHRKRFLIKSISYTGGEVMMSIDITNLDYLPLIGGIN